MSHSSGFKARTWCMAAVLAAVLSAVAAGCGSGDEILGTGGNGGVGGGAALGPGPAGPAPDLLGATAFGGFGGAAGMTNGGTGTVITGAAGQPVSIGTTGATTLMTGFHDNSVPYIPPSGCIYTETVLNIGAVNGTIITGASGDPNAPTCPLEGTAATAALALAAFNGANAAFIDLRDRPGGLDVSTCPGCGGGLAGELGLRTLAPGIYRSAVASYGITTGDLTLNGGGNANAVWVFQMPASTLTVGLAGTPRSVNCINGCQPKNVFWQVGSSADINLGDTTGAGVMVGTIISLAGSRLSLSPNPCCTTLNGRMLALTASTTMFNATINVPAP